MTNELITFATINIVFYLLEHAEISCQNMALSWPDSLYNSFIDRAGLEGCWTNLISVAMIAVLTEII